MVCCLRRVDGMLLATESNGVIQVQASAGQVCGTPLGWAEGAHHPGR